MWKLIDYFLTLWLPFVGVFCGITSIVLIVAVLLKIVGIDIGVIS